MGRRSSRQDPGQLDPGTQGSPSTAIGPSRVPIPEPGPPIAPTGRQRSNPAPSRSGHGPRQLVPAILGLDPGMDGAAVLGFTAATGPMSTARSCPLVPSP